MPATIKHIFSNAIADGTNTNIVRPVDWNSVHAITLNISGTDISAAFSNLNGVSFGTEAGGKMTASIQTSYAASNHSHGNPTLALTNLSGTTASNSAGLTLSLSANAAAAGVGIEAGTRTATTAGNLRFETGNGITFGLNGVGGSVMTASHNAITTGRASNDAIGLNTALTANGVSMTANSSGLSLNFPAFLTTAAQSSASNVSGVIAGTNATGGTATLSGNVSFSNANGISFYTSAGNAVVGTVRTDYQSAGAYLTTAALSNHSHGNPTLNLTNINGTTASNSAGLTLSLSAIVPAQSVQPVAASASNGSYNFSTLKFVEGSGVTWATQANGIQASVKTDYLTTAMLSNAATISNINFSAGTTSGLLSALTFADGGGVSFGLNAGTVTGTVATTYAASNHSHGNPTLALTNLSGTTASNSAGLTLSLSAAAPGAGGGIALSAGSDSNFTNGTVTFGNAFSGSFVTSNGSVVYSNAFLTTAAQSGHSHGNPTLALTNLSGTTASNSAGLTLSLSANSPAAGVGIEAGTRTATTAGNLRWETGNGITFGLDAVGGSVMTASHNALTTAAQSDHSHGNPTLALTNLTGTTASASNGLTISLSAAAAGGGNTYSTHIPYYPASTGVQTLGAAGVTSASAFFWPIYLKENIVFNRIEQLMTFSNVSSATAASGAQSITHNFGIFSLDVNTLKSISTGSYSIAATCSSGSATLSYPVSYSTGGGYTWTTTAGTASAQVQSLWGTAGNRIVTFGFGGNMTLTPGLYVLGLHQRQSTTNFNVGVIPALAGNVMAAMQNVGPLGIYTTVLTGGGTHTKVPWGIATSTGAADYGGSKLPTSMVISNISRTMTNMPMCTFISR